MRRIHSIFFLVALSVFFVSCHRSSYQKNMKKISDVKQEKAKVTMKEYEAALERHEDIQSDDTRTRMKKSKKKANAFNKRSRVSFGKACPVAK